mgnify:CR=1 FL=1
MIAATVSPPTSVVPLYSMRKLEHLLGCERGEMARLAERAGAYYKPFDLRRGGEGGKWRHIDNPGGDLKVLQRRIQKRILNPIVLPDCMFGAVPGRSVLMNARVHLRQPVVVTMDLRNCFPRIGHPVIFGVFKGVLQCSEDIASLLTRLTTYQGRLPQGAPSSPALCNLSLLPLVGDVLQIAADRGLRATFFVDDTTLSGPAAEDAIDAVARAVMAHGHAIGRKKTRVMRANERQMVTGTVVNRHPAVLRELRQEIRYEILELADMQEVPAYELQRIRGRIAHVKATWRLHGEDLEQFADRLLPEVGVPGEKPRTRETRPCTHVRRHRFKVRPSSRTPVATT